MVNLNHSFKNVEDLSGKVIGIGRGFSHGLEFRSEREEKSLQWKKTPSTARFKKLSRSRVI